MSARLPAVSPSACHAGITSCPATKLGVTHLHDVGGAKWQRDFELHLHLGGGCVRIDCLYKLLVSDAAVLGGALQDSGGPDRLLQPQAGSMAGVAACMRMAGQQQNQCETRAGSEPLQHSGIKRTHHCHEVNRIAFDAALGVCECVPRC